MTCKVWGEFLGENRKTVSENHIKDCYGTIRENKQKTNYKSREEKETYKDTTDKNNDVGLEGLTYLRKQYLTNPIIGYLNINTFHHKINGLRAIVKDAPLEIFCIDETKLDHSFS